MQPPCFGGSLFAPKHCEALSPSALGLFSQPAPMRRGEPRAPTHSGLTFVASTEGVAALGETRGDPLAQPPTQDDEFGED